MEIRDHAFGRHFLVEFIGCPAGNISYVSSIRSALLEAARLSQATVLEAYYHQFMPYGVTGMLFIAESHFSIHTWPESGYAAFDILTCGEMLPEKAIDHLKSALMASRVDIRVFPRGFNDLAR